MQRQPNDRLPRFADLRRGYFRLFLLSLCVLAVYFALDAAGRLSIPARFAWIGGFLVLSYAAARWYLRVVHGMTDGRETADGDCADATLSVRVLLPLFALYFALYLHLLLTLTLLDPSLGRDLVFAENSRAYYMEWYFNLRPFGTIWTVYLEAGLGKGLLSLRSVLYNIGGNLAALSPLAFFLPLFWCPMRHAYVFLPTVVLTAAAIEGLQFAFMRGSCDIDDLLLNAGGAFAVYLILRIPPLSRLVRRLTAGLWDVPRREER